MRRIAPIAMWTPRTATEGRFCSSTGCNVVLQASFACAEPECGGCNRPSGNYVAWLNEPHRLVYVGCVCVCVCVYI